MREEEEEEEGRGFEGDGSGVISIDAAQKYRAFFTPRPPTPQPQRISDSFSTYRTSEKEQRGRLKRRKPADVVGVGANRSVMAD